MSVSLPLPGTVNKMPAPWGGRDLPSACVSVFVMGGGGLGGVGV